MGASEDWCQSRVTLTHCWFGPASRVSGIAQWDSQFAAGPWPRRSPRQASPHLCAAAAAAAAAAANGQHTEHSPGHAHPCSATTPGALSHTSPALSHTQARRSHTPKPDDRTHVRLRTMAGVVNTDGAALRGEGGRAPMAVTPVPLPRSSTRVPASGACLRSSPGAAAAPASCQGSAWRTTTRWCQCAPCVLYRRSANSTRVSQRPAPVAHARASIRQWDRFGGRRRASAHWPRS